MNTPARIAILGGGVSGALVAYHLLSAPTAMSLTMIAPETRLGPGLAFGRCEPFHLLNVPAGRMSALTDTPLHFLSWLERAPAGSSRRELIPSDLGPNSFVSRLLFGDYIEALLRDATRQSRSSFHHIEDTAMRIDRVRDGYRITLGHGETLDADTIVLALGNVAPTATHPACAALVGHPRYSHTMWDDLPWREATSGETVLFIGTGLTMVDGALAFARAGHSGKMIGLSRRGLLPAVHRLGASAPTFLSPETNPLDLRHTVAAVRAEVRARRDSGVPWQAVLDSLRSITPELWGQFSDTDRRRFLRHVKSYWETNRHRLAPELHREIDSLVESGRLSIRAGNIIQVDPTAAGLHVAIRSRGSSTMERFTVDRVVNCTGPESTISAATSPLFRSLFESGLVSSDSLHLGLRAAPSGFVIDRNDVISTGILTLGPLLKGLYWETTAVPEIRVQAARVSCSILERLGAKPSSLPS